MATAKVERKSRETDNILEGSDGNWQQMVGAARLGAINHGFKGWAGIIGIGLCIVQRWMGRFQ